MGASEVVKKDSVIVTVPFGSSAVDAVAASTYSVAVDSYPCVLGQKDEPPSPQGVSKTVASPIGLPAQLEGGSSTLAFSSNV